MDLAELSPRRERFCQEYVKDLNGTQAAIRAGYSPKTATVKASQLFARQPLRLGDLGGGRFLIYRMQETPARAAAAAVKCKDEGWTLYGEVWARIGKAAEVMLAHGEGTVH